MNTKDKLLDIAHHFVDKDHGCIELCDVELMVSQMVNILEPQGISDKDVELIVNAWLDNDNLIKPQNTPKGLKQIANKRVKEYGLKEVLEAIYRYSEVLASSYFFSYKWNIETFFRRKNGISEFMNGGMQWENYLADKDNGKPKPITGDIELTVPQIRDFLDKYEATYYECHKVVGIGSTEELNKKKRSSFDSILGKIYPVVSAYYVKHYNYFCMLVIDNPYNNKSFEIKYDKVVVYDKSGSVESTLDYNKEFNKINT